MGFTTGFTGGVTLTLGIAYLTVLAHERNRQSQAFALRSQSRVLNSLLEPSLLPPPQTRAELAREERNSMVETAKDRWNEEIENAVRWVQRTDFGEVREGLEGAISRLIGGGLEKSREGVESGERVVGGKAQEAVDAGRAKAREGAERTAEAVDRSASKAISATERAGVEVNEGGSRIAALAKEKADQAGVKAVETKNAVKVKADQAGAEAKTGLKDAAESIRNSGGTVDAARGAVRDVIAKGIEKGREVVAKAQSAVGMAAEKVESKAGLLKLDPVEKALEQRYEKPHGLEKSVEQALEERYKPIDSRDNTVLRGV